MKIQLIFLFFFVFITIYGQEIETDRPDQTEATSIVPKKYLQMETGIIHEVQDKNISSTESEILFKYGIFERLELRFRTAYSSQNFYDEKTNEFAPLAFGVKAKISDEQKGFPSISALGHFTMNKWASKNMQTPHHAYDFRFLFSHTLTEKMGLGYNIGIEWNGENQKYLGLYTLSFSYSLTSKTGIFAEKYGFFSKNNAADNRINFGVTHLINSNFQADASSGIGLSSSSPDYYMAAGISYRFTTQK
ncbi:MAG: transporter [Bergeyella sp.]